MNPRICFVSGDSFAGDRLKSGAFILGVAGFGVERPRDLDADCPFVSVGMESLRGDACFEVWTCEAPVRWRLWDGFRVGDGSGIVFGVSELAFGATEAVAFDVYSRLVSVARAAGAPHVHRVFNYLPSITADENGTERYRRFNVGRHDAFDLVAKTWAAYPAACALGVARGPGAIAFVASDRPGKAVENPRQISAFQYPAIYGKRSPSFSRAMLTAPGADRMLYISGTASIVGHESLHPGDAGAQTEEILRNLEALLASCGAPRLAALPAGLTMKVYIRHQADLPAVSARLAVLPNTAQLMVLQAEICRKELLVEIEVNCPLGPA
jgi:enamine deaminase RidA (YjgF/YER057c/UK114 family)